MTLSAQKRSLFITCLVAGASYMEMLDSTIIATALPEMAKSFHTSPIHLSSGMSVYMLALGVFIPISGWIADRFGGRTVFGSAITIFTIASILCGVSRNELFFTAARVLQGMGGAMMVPVGRLLVLRNTEKKDLLSAIAYLTWPPLLAPLIGPPLGGFITTYWGWRWIFLLNVPLGVAALILTVFLIPNEHTGERPPLDFRGFLLSGSSCVLLVYGLDLLGREHTPWMQVAVSIAVGLVLGFFTVQHSRQHPKPLLDFSALKIQTYSVMIWGGTLFRLTAFAIPFLFPLLFQVGFGMSAFASGVLMLVNFAANVAVKPVTTPIIRRFGFRKTLLGNGVLVVLSVLMCCYMLPTTPRWFIWFVLFAGGLVRSMQFTCINTIGFADVPQPQLTAANTLYSTLLQLAIALGIAYGAICLHLATFLRSSSGVTVGDFRLAFVFVAVPSLFSLWSNLRMDKHAGAVVSGHAKVLEPTPVEEPV